MKKNYFILVLVCVFLLVTIKNYAQTKATVNINSLEETDEGILIVKYSFDNIKSNEQFDVELSVKQGYNNLNVSSVTGDIGNNIDGKGEKTIEWNLLKDNIVLNEYVDVQLIVDVHEDLSNLSLTNLMLTSTLLPGMGLNRLDRDYNYKLMGYTGYGLIGTAFLFNSMAKSSYNKYTLELTDYDLRAKYYSRALTYRTVTNVFIFGAVGIWLTDYLWLYLKKSSLDKKYSFISPNNNFRIGAGYNNFANKPMLNLQWYF